MAVPNIISGNLTASILAAPNIFFNASYSKSNNYEKDWLRFDQENFVLDSLKSLSLYLTLMHL